MSPLLYEEDSQASTSPTGQALQTVPQLLMFVLRCYFECFGLLFDAYGFESIDRVQQQSSSTYFASR